MKTIFDSIDINHLFLKNRIIRSATWEALANKDGSLSKELIDVYENLAKGGVGAIITGFTSVDHQDNYLENVARINNDYFISQWQTLVNKVHKQDVPIIVQLALGEFVRNKKSIEPSELSDKQIRELIEMFGDAAKRAEKAGFDGVQIHVAHGFYLSRFISPLYNYRCDAYCGKCGNKLTHSPNERSLYCTHCGNIEYPKIAPVVMIAVTNREQILLTRFSTERNFKPWVLVSGFVEIGETLEEAAKREVFEETGLHIKNLKYFGNQPWGLSESIIVGFIAQLDGDENLCIDHKELLDAKWCSRDQLPQELTEESITYEFIKAFRNGDF